MDQTAGHHLVPDHDVRVARLREFFGTGLWFIPGLCVVTAVVLAVVMETVDDRLGGDWPAWLVLSRDRASAADLLAAIASGTLAFTGVVFSITIVALQLASSQFSPRVLRAFLRDRASQWPLGIFLATFIYALMALRNVQAEPGPGEAEVAGLSITVAFALVLASLFSFVYFVHHIAQSIRAVNIIDVVAKETRAAIRENFPDEAAPASPGPVPDRPPDQVVTFEHGPGALLGVDEDDLVAVAARHDCVLSLLPCVGDFLPSRVPLLAVYGGDGKITPEEVLPYVGVGAERTMFQDPAFGFRQLVDIAGRALSPAINDPTTAVQCVDRIHDLLRRLAVRPQPPGRHHDAGGELRLVVPVASFDQFVDLAFDEIRLYGVSSLQVTRRLRAALEDLLTVTGPDRQGGLRRQLRLLDESLPTAFRADEDRRFASQPDSQGIGS